MTVEELENEVDRFDVSIFEDGEIRKLVRKAYLAGFEEAKKCVLSKKTGLGGLGRIAIKYALVARKAEITKGDV